MKKLALLLLFSNTILFSQNSKDSFNYDESNMEYYYENIHELDSTLKTAQPKITEWIALNFNDSNNVLKFNSNEKTIVKGIFNISYSSAGYPIKSNVEFDMIFSYKDYKYRIQLKDIMVVSQLSPGNEVKVPIASYAPSNMNLESYKEMLVKVRDTLTDKYAIKAYDKMLKNDDQLKATLEQSKNLYNQIYTKVLDECRAIDQSVYNYVLSRKEKDKW